MGGPGYISRVADALGEAPEDLAGAERGPRVTLALGSISFVPLAGLVGLLAWRYWPTSVFWVSASSVPLLGAVCVVDVRERRVPNALVAAGFVLVAAGLGGIGAATGDWRRSGGAAVGAAVLSFPLLASHLTSRRRLPGLGDVKLAAVLGLVVGMVHPLLAGYALLLALLSGVTLSGLRRARRLPSGTFPFAPALCGGAITMLVAGPWWLARLGLAPM